ncbi:hypothetical protein NDU88_008280 [Pleurodeles waltl]|uniref:Uncharacterized protein n=1 Tax=Pleurodeles waltl TaxID=8319 RepID=A0AAV7VVZ1_PLEWA|nr:hypothetical protein NDU88_008280 [Pleurodeles waltl]
MPPRRLRDRIPARVRTLATGPTGAAAVRANGGNWEHATLEVRRVRALTSRVTLRGATGGKADRGSTKRSGSMEGRISAQLPHNAEHLEVLENNARRNNIKIMNVPEGVEGDNIKMFVVGRLSQCGMWEGSEDLLSQDIQRVHRDPFRKSPNAAKPRRILVNVLTYVIKKKILSRALKTGTLNASGFSFEIRSDVSRTTSNRQ